MRFRPSPALLPVLMTALTASTAMPALAADADEVVKRLTNTLGKSGYEIIWESTASEGDDIIVKDVTAGLATAEGRVELGDIRLSGVGEADGAYTISQMSLPAYSMERDGVKMQIEGVSASGIVLPPEGAEKSLRSVVPYDQVSMEKISFTRGGENIFQLENFNSAAQFPEDGSAATFTAAAERFEVNPASFPDPKTRATMAALGYGTIEGSMTMNGGWTLTDGRMTADTMAFKVKDAGDLTFGVDISGYTIEFIESLQAIQKNMAANGEDASSGIAMLGLMQQLNLHSARLRFDDASLTGRVLEFLAQQQGMKPADIANQAKAILPFMLAKLNNPEFAMQVTTAVSAFLDDPQSLEIKAEPAAPLPVAMIIAGGMSAPEQLPQTLGAKVLANQ